MFIFSDIMTNVSGQSLQGFSMSNNNNSTILRWLGCLDRDILLKNALARHAIVIYSDQLSEILWANLSGANLFGGANISDFMTTNIQATHPFIQQLKSAVRQLGEEPIYRGFRLVNEGKSRFIQCEIGLIDFHKTDIANNEDDHKARAIIVKCANSAMENLEEHEFAQFMLKNFAGLKPVAAICDQYGLAIAATDSFAEFEISPQVMENACSELNKSNEVSLHLEDAPEKDHIRAEFFLLGNDPKRILMLGENGSTNIVEKPANPSQSTNATIINNDGVDGFIVDANDNGDEKGQLENNKAPEKSEENRAIVPDERSHELTEQPKDNTGLDESSNPPNEKMKKEPDSKTGFVSGVVAGVAAASTAIFKRSENQNETSADADASTNKQHLSPQISSNDTSHHTLHEGENNRTETNPPSLNKSLSSDVPQNSTTNGTLNASLDVGQGEKLKTDKSGNPDETGADIEDDISTRESGESSISVRLQDKNPASSNEAEQEINASKNTKLDVPNFDNDSDISYQGADFVYSGDTKPVRFAWITNTDQVFTSISPELANAVGPNAADIIGRKWSDVATVFGFDTTGEVHSLLKKQDTWSGKTVLWPIQGTDLHVPVDLAALPSFSSGRNFDGFRGFGIVRALDVIVDPLETGLALANDGTKKSSKILDEQTLSENNATQLNTVEEIESSKDRSNQDENYEQGTVIENPSLDDQNANGLYNSKSLAMRNQDDVNQDKQIQDKQIWDEDVSGSQAKLIKPTNVVKLQPRNDADNESSKLIGNAQLTNGENRAFDEIGKELRDTTSHGVLKPGADKKNDDKSSGKHSNAAPDISTPDKDLSANALANNKDEDARKNKAPVFPQNIARVVNTDDRSNQDNAEKNFRVDTSLLEHLPVPVLIYRGDETLFANRELLSLTGYNDFADLDKAGGINALFDRGNFDEIADDSKTVLSDKDGGKMKVRALLQKVPWDKTGAMLLSFRQPKHAKLPANEKIVLDMMRVSELHNVLDTAADGIIILDKDGLVHSINKSAEALFGRSDKEIVEKPINDLFASESHQRISEYICDIVDPEAKNLLNNGCEVIGLEAKGGMIPLFITLGKIDESDKYCAVLRDMTPWKKTREELIEAKKLAEDASEQKTEFLARISHEIRTPLNAIIGFSDVMIEERFGPIDNERYREYLRDINRSGIHVLDLINDLLDISKIEAGKMELSFEAVDLNKIVGESVALLQPQANGGRVLVRTSLSRAVPKVVADARSIRQIVINLVSNAIKFTNTNGQVIISTVYEGNGEVAMRVRDTGRGMSEEEIAIALKPFRQVNAVAETHGQGTGLGLPLTKALVEANRAYMDIDSEPGEGTIVHIQFPTQRVLAD